MNKLQNFTLEEVSNLMRQSNTSSLGENSMVSKTGGNVLIGSVVAGGVLAIIVIILFVVFYRKK